MFEFLKNTLTIVYNKAIDIEMSMCSINLPNVMASFCETVLKNIYIKYNRESEKCINSITLDKLVNEEKFSKYLGEEYDYFSLDDINKIRIEANKSKHNKDYCPLSEDKKLFFFQIVFSLASKYSAHETGVEPSFDIEKYNEIINQAKDVNVLYKKNDILKNEIERVKRDCDVLKQAIGEKKQEIFNLKKEKELVREKEIDESKFKEYKKKICALEDEKDKLLKKKNDFNTKYQKIQIELESLKEKNDDLENENSDLTKLYNQKLHECAELNDRINHLVKQIEDTTKRQKEFEKEIDRDDILKNNTSYINLDNQYRKNILEVEEKSIQLSNNQRQVAQLKESSFFQEMLSEKLKELDSLINENTPICQSCGARMKESNYGPEFYCPNYKTLKCNKRPMSDSYRKWLRDREEIKNRLKERENNNNQNEYYYEDIPVVQSSYSNYFFDSLAIPKELFSNNELDFNKYSKFALITNCNKKKVDVKELVIYNLIIRLLNRGFVLPCDKDIDDIFKTKFNIDENASINQLFDFVKYKKPIFGYTSINGNGFDSQYEKIFVEKILPSLIGESWASYVLYQPKISMIVKKKELKDKYLDSRVDFLLTKNNKKFVFELDGKEHYIDNSKLRYSDVERDNDLNAEGVKVKRIKNDVIKSLVNNEIVASKFRSILNENEKIEYLNYDIRYLFAIKLFHQLCISIVYGLSKGFISKRTNLRLKTENVDFSQNELDFIMYFAAKKVAQLVEYYCNIYDINIDIDLLDKHENERTIYFGDGNDERDLLLIRDCYIDFDYLCDFEKVDMPILPKKIDLNTGLYFLNYIFGFNSFKEGQYQAVERIILREESIILLPTGAGKSVIYQLSSFLVPGITIVISPLKALINDQVINLKNVFGITNSYKITSDDKVSEKQETLLKIRNNNCSLLYITPERLQVPSFKNSIKEFLSNNIVYTLAIDEVHCVSEWGHDFRSAYINIAKASSNLFKRGNFIPSIIGLTGTASGRVLNDVKRDLEMTNDDAIISAKSFDRKGFEFSIISCDSSKKEEVIEELLVEDLPKKYNVDTNHFSSCNKEETYSGIVFTRTTKSLGNDDISKQYSARDLKNSLSLKLTSFKFGNYFSTPPKGYTEEDWNNYLKQTASNFKNNEINVLIATKAFGMGIDKPNIRYIIHDGIPESLESYYQEAGRAGRDGKGAKCLIIFSNKNDDLNEKLLDPSLSFNEFNKIYNDNESYLKSNKDDLSTLFYFHVQTFKGIEKELRIIKAFIDVIKNYNTFNLCQVNELLSEENKIGEKNDSLRSIVRLRILNVISDYSYDYNLKQFFVTINKFDREAIADAYANYVASYDKGRISIEREKVLRCELDGWDYVFHACKVLVTYVYDNFEKGRRREIKNMYGLAKRALRVSDERQSDFIRNEITKFFNTDNKYTNAVLKIVDAKDCGFSLIASDYDLYETDISNEGVEDEQSIADAGIKCAKAQNELKNNPTHPGLYYYEVISMFKSNQIDEDYIFNEVKAANKYIREDYKVSDRVITDMFFMTINECLKKSYNLFERLVDMYTTYEDRTLITDKMLDSSLISEDNKDIILLDYLNHIL